MSVVDQEVGVEGRGGEVVDAAGAVGDVTEDEAVGGAGEGEEDVGEVERVHEESFGELKGDAVGAGGEDPVHAFVHFEVVV